MKCQERPRIILVPYPAQGHVTPMLQLALALRGRGFDTVIANPTFIHYRIASPSSAEDGIVFAPIPDGLEDDEPRDFFTIHHAMESNMPVHFKRLLQNFKGDSGGVVCIVVDLLASWAIDVARSCSVPAAGFWPAMLATYRLISTIPDMIRVGLISKDGTPKHKGMVRFLPGQPMLCTQDLPWLVGSPTQQKSRFMFWRRTLERTRSLRWLLVNSFGKEGDEDPPLDQNPRIFNVGPLTRLTMRNLTLWEEDKSCLEWLSKQRPCSVVYVSFGSWVGPIGEDKVHELALGLEATRRPFIWVLGEAWRSGLPVGYLERVAGQGKVVSWAPQKEVLKHNAVGCYLTHCGWNSTMEAIEGGKRLLCYPVSGDQFVNCAYIVRVWGIGAKVTGFGRRDIEEGVKRVIEEGGEMQKRLMELKAGIMEEGSLRAVDSLTGFMDAVNNSKPVDDWVSCLCSL
eukprot:TRINITY_DN1503_c0_g1_i2.p1 TRINITY_DN1503_c0_g1~~TRINITY_DN1503_c0_g1_i2.p1  ORF type:complete len:455 (-),score=33.39 TRINITY_DN1503_c0_g1_i2:61-1425(-)